MRLFKSHCENCNADGYIFPDQVEIIKKKGKNSPFHKWIHDLHVGQDWICIACHSTNCKIAHELPSEKARKLIDIRSRETNLESRGWILPNTSSNTKKTDSGIILP